MGYVNQFREMRCDFDFFEHLDDHIRLSKEWKNMRENLWDLYKVFPLVQMFPEAPIYVQFVEPSPRNPVEALTASLLNSMEINLANLYYYLTILEFERLPILMTENRMRQRIVRKPND
jgi:hypothetical protein